MPEAPMPFGIDVAPKNSLPQPKWLGRPHSQQSKLSKPKPSFNLKPESVGSSPL